MTQTKKKLHFNLINAKIASNIEDILRTLDVDYISDSNRVSFRCPIHDSDNDNSCNIYTTGNNKVGNYMCWTHHCEEETGTSSIFVIKKLLENKQKRKASISDVLKYLNIAEDQSQQLEDKPLDNLNLLVEEKQERQEESYKIGRDFVRKNLVIPAGYYLQRGFKSSTLNHFDIGFSNNRSLGMYGRVVVPLYNDNQMFTGCVGRTINPKCTICGYYHMKNRMCPEKSAASRFSKWSNSHGFTSGHHLYNLWNAKKDIQDTGSIILVEGQGDCWKTFEAGVKITTGLFGNKLTRQQFNLINKLGVQNVFLALDNDDKGREGADKIEKMLTSFYNVYRIKYEQKDLGDTPVDQVKDIFKRFIN